jgi:hypothetical protein
MHFRGDNFRWIERKHVRQIVSIAVYNGNLGVT